MFRPALLAPALTLTIAGVVAGPALLGEAAPDAVASVAAASTGQHPDLTEEARTCPAGQHMTGTTCFANVGHDDRSWLSGAVAGALAVVGAAGYVILG